MEMEDVKTRRSGGILKSVSGMITYTLKEGNNIIGHLIE